MTIESLFQKKEELAGLLDHKIDLIKGLIDSEKQLKTLIAPNDQDWLTGFTIEHSKQLDVNGKRKTRLGDLNKRIEIQKSQSRSLDELDVLDSKVKIALLDLVIEKINFTIERK